MTRKPTNRGGVGEIETFAMANCLMLLSSQAASAAAASAASAAASATAGGQSNDGARMFTCKTCGRKFSSFQALGGHRASHKKLKPPSGGDSDEKTPAPAKPKTHACSICGLEFPIGQALGGHMRRHRAVLPSGGSISTITMEKSNDNNSDANNSIEKKRKNDVVFVPVLKKSNSNKRVCLDLTLNFPAWEGDKDVVDDEHEFEDGEISQEFEEEEKDDLKLELRQPIN